MGGAGVRKGWGMSVARVWRNDGSGAGTKGRRFRGGGGGSPGKGGRAPGYGGQIERETGGEAIGTVRAL